MKIIVLLAVFYFIAGEKNLTKDGHCGYQHAERHGSEDVTVLYRETFCCRNFENIGGNCIKCKKGFVSSGKKCRPCNYGFYGEKCAEVCHCTKNETCDNVHGCKIIATDDDTLNTSKNPDNETDNGQRDVIIYMSCIAAPGMFFVMVIAFCKVRHRIIKVTKPERTLTLPSMVHNLAPPFEETRESCSIDVRREGTDVYNAIDEEYITGDFSSDEEDYV